MQALGLVTPLTAFSNPLVSALCVALMGIKVEKEAKDTKDQATFANTFIALPTTIREPHENLRLDFPLPLWLRPVARGPHVAVVIGPDGVDAKNGELYADALGRVRVRFPWDPGPPQGSDKLPPIFPVAQPESPTKVGSNTCWLRVSEGWAGDHFGTQFLPRIGQEVIVSFLDGDPERPIVTGRVYNAQSGFSRLPFLPDQATEQKLLLNMSDLQGTERKTWFRSGIKTESTFQPGTSPPGDQSVRYHLLRFDDTYHREQYLIRSQGRLDMTVFNHRYENISGNRNLTVGGKSYKDGQPLEIHGDYVTKIYKHYYLHVGDPDFLAASGPKSSGNRVTRLEQNEELSVGKNYQLDAGTYSALTGNHYLHASGRSGGGGGNRITLIDGDDKLHAKSLTQWIDGSLVTYCNGFSTKAKSGIRLEDDNEIALVVGQSSIVLTPGQINLVSPVINASQQINFGQAVGSGPFVGPLPAPPPATDPAVVRPHEPTNADRGDSITPPQWQDDGIESPTNWDKQKSQ
jgi:hypothetical protein